jgi:hypothetical protein
MFAYYGAVPHVERARLLEAPPPTNQPWAFSILDHSHLFIILETGTTQPMTVQSVDVWQTGTPAYLVKH